MFFWIVNFDNLVFWFCFKRFIFDVISNIKDSFDILCMYYFLEYRYIVGGFFMLFDDGVIRF